MLLFQYNYKMYNIYNKIKSRLGRIIPLPTINIKKRPTDIYVTKGFKRLDQLAYDFYDDADLWKIILIANPLFKNDFTIHHNVVIRVPYPINDVLNEINEQLDIVTRI